MFSPYTEKQMAVLDHYLSLYHRLIEQQWSQAPNPAHGLCISPQEAQVLSNPDLSIASLREIFFDSSEGKTWQKKLVQLEEHANQIEAEGTRLLAERFQLSRFSYLTLLSALAPEWDSRYQKIYGYLQDNLNLRLPSVGWLRTLFFVKDIWPSHDPIFRYRLISPVPDSLPLFGNEMIALDRRILGFLAGTEREDNNLRPFCHWHWLEEPYSQIPLPKGIQDILETKGKSLFQRNSSNHILLLSGLCEKTRQCCAQNLFQQARRGMLSVSLARLLGSEHKSMLLRTVFREARLHGMGLFLGDIEALEDAMDRDVIEDELKYFPHCICLSGEGNWDKQIWQRRYSVSSLSLPGLTMQDREKLWRERLVYSRELKEEEIRLLSARYRFTPAQIHDVLDMYFCQKSGSLEALYEICRCQFSHKLEHLALHILPKWKWEDLVLRNESKEQLREICDRIKYQSLVYDDWGMAEKVASANGLIALFSGSPGTGKTMAASIMARELMLELYKIDLSQVVSKYIGETEKNLEKIFNEAEKGNVLLLFDEADALFGKRSEVKDAHDRYANIEVSYLLQRLERHPGFAILATNFAENMDEAFCRRIHCKVDFPFPDVEARKEIWTKAFGSNTPLSPNLDFALLARRFPLSGGHIQNIALSAAFFAAAQGKSIEMKHLFTAARREYEKMGKIFPEE